MSSPETDDFWRALYCDVGQEIEVADEIARRDVPSFCPRYRLLPTTNRLGRAVVERTVPFLRSYVFARFDPTDPVAWHRVHDVKGVRWMVPGVALDSEITRLSDFVGATGELSATARLYVSGQPLLEPGDLCRLTQGCFAEFQGTVTDVDPKNFRVGVRIALFGRQSVVNQPLSWCELVDHRLSQPPKRRMRRRRGGR